MTGNLIPSITNEIQEDDIKKQPPPGRNLIASSLNTELIIFSDVQYHQSHSSTIVMSARCKWFTLTSISIITVITSVVDRSKFLID